MSELKRTLGPISGAALMLNIVIGAGLLTLPGLAFSAAGPMAVYSWIVCTTAAVPLLLVFIIMGRKYPDAGGIAHFAERAFGRLGYIAASLLFIGAVLFGLPAIAMTGGYYLASLVNIDPAIIAMLLLMSAAVTQTAAPDKASKITTMIASTVIAALLVTITIGFVGSDIDQFPRAIPPVETATMQVVMAPFLMIFFAFTGWEVAAGISEEFKNPKRDFPIAMAVSFVAAVALYLAMAVLVQISPPTQGSEAAFVGIIDNVLGAPGAIAVACIAGLIILANLMGAIWAVSRMLYSLSRENVLPITLSVDESGRPLGAVLLLVCALIAIVMLDYVGVLNISTMLHMAGQNFLILYGVGAVALLALSDSVLLRAVALLALSIVLVVLVAVGDFIGYPVILLTLAVAIWAFERKLNARKLA